MSKFLCKISEASQNHCIEKDVLKSEKLLRREFYEFEIFSIHSELILI